MLADDILKILPRVIMFLFKLFKGIIKIVIFTGTYWLLVPVVPPFTYELITKKSSNLPIFNFLFIPLFVIGAILALMTLIQNTIRMVRKDRSFNIFKAIFNLKKDKLGIVAPLKSKEQTVALCTAENLHGFFFGRDKGKFVTVPEMTDSHVLIIGGAGSGKTASIAIPTLYSWKERVFAIDIKGELYERTKRARNENNIKVFNPTDRNAYGYDPFYMLKISDDLSAEARALALSIVPLPADVRDPFWIKSAQNMLTGFIIYFFDMGMNFSQTMKLIKSKSVKKLVAEIMESGNERAIVEVSQFDEMDEKTLSGIFTELSNHITIFATSEELQQALNGEGSCIAPNDLEEEYDVFCCIPEHKLEQWKELLGMMCNQFLKFFERRQESSKTPILFLIDEFPRLGKIETISNGLATLRSKKIHIALIVQSKSQLNAIYGKDVAEVIADNCSYKAILKASSPETQEWCSKLVGTYDKEKKSSSYNADVMGIGKGQGVSTTTEEKRIIKPEEFAYLNDVVCVFPNGYRRLEKVMYFKEKAFAYN